MRTPWTLALALPGFIIAAALPAPAQCELDKLLASDGVADDGFGASVAVDGDLAVVGATGADGQGAAYVFRRSAGAWTEERKLTASDGAAGDNFGFTVATSGGTVVVGAIFDDDAGDASGGAYVFEEVLGVWTETQKLTGSEALAGDFFSIGLSIEGERLIVGACQFFGFLNTGIGKGKGYVYERVAGTWVEDEILTSSDGVDGDRFSVSVSLDGDRVLLGTEDDDAARGSAYIFELEAGVWTEKQRLTASDGAVGDQFGVSVSLEGDVALIGAHRHDGAADDAGAAYVFERVSGSWTEITGFTAPGALVGDRLGRSVSLDGDIALVGAQQASSGNGVAFLLERDGLGGWVETHTMHAGDGAFEDRFGYAVDKSGSTLFMGALGAGPGAAYEFELPAGPAPALIPYGCGINPAGSLVIQSGTGELGSDVVLGIDNPLGTMNPGARSFVILSFAPDPNFPCGTQLAKFGMGAGPGELLARPVFVAGGPVWTGTGNPASITIPMPDDCAFLGVSAYIQGLLFDPTQPAGDRFGLTTAVELVGGL